MPEKAYTLHEIDQIRHLIMLIEYGNHEIHFAGSVAEHRAMKIIAQQQQHVEQLLRTYLSQGISPEDLETKLASLGERPKIVTKVDPSYRLGENPFV